MQPEHDWHAGLAETSVMMFLKPDLVREKFELDKPEVIEWMRLGNMNKILVSKKTINHPSANQLHLLSLQSEGWCV